MSESTIKASGGAFQEAEQSHGGLVEAIPAAEGAVVTETVVPRAVGRRAESLRHITIFSDITALCLALIVACGLSVAIGRSLPEAGDLLLFIALIPVWMLVAGFYGLYRVPERTSDWSFADDLSAAFVACSIWGWFWLVARSAIDVATVLPSVTVWAASILLIPILRSGVRRHLRTADWYRQTVLLVGTPVGVNRVQKRIERQPDWCFDVIETIQVGGRFDPEARADTIAERARGLGVGRVIVADAPVDMVERTGLIRDLLEVGVHVDLVSSEADVFRPTAFIDHLEGLPTLAFAPVRLSPAANRIKRAIDVVLAAILLVLLAPLLAYIALRIKLDSPGPVLFRQDRRGLGGTHFKLFKFRTMTVDAEERLDEVSELKLHPDSATFKAIEDPRVTRYGASLRRRSFDELPQLWNVLTGDMSLVGPRPLPLDEATHVPPRYRARENVRPGLTGPWQVLGRSDIPFEDMVKLDYMYVSTWSPRGDLKLLLRTIGVVFAARGAY
ncbi:MAG TPA: exopolysaccharide biosynthesis polyprenyl glycosylphosphotransferase [Solirubrobacterales bacterium]|nr:exopolysaccharide biosynthesis polyprenyl glycosylphosphotransferase [Solirubrobacterales bacterium]